MKNGAKSPIFLFENPKTCPKTCQTSYKKISFEKSALGRKVQRVRQQTWSPLIVHQALNFHFMDFGPHILTFPIMRLANCIQSPSTFDICTFWSPTSHFLYTSDPFSLSFALFSFNWGGFALKSQIHNYEQKPTCLYQYQLDLSSQ